MEHHLSPFGELVNRLLGPALLPLLEALGYHPHDPHQPIPDHVATQVLIALLLVLFALWFRTRLSAANPGALQLCFESLLTNSFRVGIYDLLDSIAGHHGRKHLAFVGTVGLFVFVCNAISLFPAFLPPTAVHLVPLGCALTVFVYYHTAGVMTQGGLAYAKHFIGPALAAPWWMWPVMIPLLFLVEIVSHSARLLSLTVRLWVNIMVSELIYLLFLGLGVLIMVSAWQWNKVVGGVLALAPAIVPLPFVLLHIFVALLQAFVFVVLPIVYIGMAVSEEH